MSSSYEFISEIEQDVTTYHPSFAAEEDAVLNACALLSSLTFWLVKQDRRDADLCSSAACDYLHVVGYTVYAWLWLKMLATNPENTDEHIVGRFYFGRLLPQIHALDKAVRSGADLVMDLPVEKF